MNNNLLEVQKYLMSGKSLENLKEELDIDATHHTTLPLVILNYGNNPTNKLHPIVRECRALVLEKDSWKLIARAFKRFFNWGEAPEEDEKFQWEGSWANDKEDGSLILVYRYKGEIMVNTRSTFGEGKICENGPTWRDLVIDHIDSGLHLLEGHTYIYELCSRWNKVVRDYHGTKLIPIGLFKGHEDMWRYVSIADHHFNSIEEVRDHINWKSNEDPTWEGVVLCDRNFNRIKVKNPSYLQLHKIKGNNGQFNTDILLDKIMAGDEEFLVYMPEIKEAYDKMKDIYFKLRNEVEDLYCSNFNEPTQKEFALKVKHHPLSNILFKTKKEGKHLTEVWRESKNLILKHIKLDARN